MDEKGYVSAKKHIHFGQKNGTLQAKKVTLLKQKNGRKFSKHRGFWADGIPP